MKRLRSSSLLALAVMAALFTASPCWAEDVVTGEVTEETSPFTTDVAIDTLWVLVAAFLVFFMNTGFGCVEAGFCRAKNATNILGKNFVVFAIASLCFWAVGWTLMFGNGTALFGYEGWFLQGADNSPAIDDAYQGAYSAISWTGIPLMAKFFFQLAFAATAATIVSGCVAERIHYKSFLIFTIFIAGISYPITGHWIWGDGWIANLGDHLKDLPGFWDFAGSTVVHSVGGWAGLAGILLLGPRLGKYRPSGGVQPIPGHSMALAFLGGMILWLGWFGFNPGSTMGITGDNVSLVGHIVVTTNLACAAGLLSATVIAWGILGKPDFSMTVNGALAGLVAITAPCAWVDPIGAIVIGMVGGVLVVLAVLFFDRIRIDDPVGALSVHLVNGIWGTLAIGLFAAPAIVGYEAGEDGPLAGLFYGGDVSQLITQAIGVGAVGAFTFAGAFAVWLVIKVLIGIRVDREEEIRGLDVTEMGMEAYSGFQVSDPHEHILAVAEPRSAMIPPGGKRFTLIIEGLENGQLTDAWNELCQPKQEPPPSDFKVVYPHFTTLQGNRFRFRGGDPEELKTSLERLLRDRLRNSTLRVRIEA
ncbi:MAG: ammonium transporter [Gemmataceae bacterium]